MRWATLMTALVLGLGLHWGLLQTAAWTRMFMEFSQSMPIGKALSQTFDGQHPCSLCRAIQRGRQSEADPSPSLSPSSSKLECDLPLVALPCVEAASPMLPVAALRTFRSRSDAPPKPRPRLLGVA